MKHFHVVVRPRGPLLIGGRTAPRSGADKATARDHLDRLVVPASALRGALRLELERLLRGVGQTVCSAGAAPEGEARSCSCPVCRLFGTEGVHLGRLRLGDAVLSPTATSPRLLRPQVAVARQSGTAVAQQLGFFEAGTVEDGAGDPVLRAAATLAPLDADDTDRALVEDLDLLRAACRAVRAIGGGKARGLGWVECGIEEVEGEAAAEGAGHAASPADDAPRSGTLRLTFEARAPLHFGRGRPLGSFHPTQRFAPASTVRGALAFALLERRLCRPEDEVFQGLVDAEGPVVFGAARLDGDRPLVTRRKCRSPQEHVFDDLPAELFLRLAARSGAAVTAVRACPHPDCPAPKASTWNWAAGSPQPRVRLCTKTALNRHTGTAMDRRLYSMEVLEPVVAQDGPDTGEAPLELAAEISGLSAEQAALLRRLDGEELWLGGKRSRGLGRCGIRVGPGEAGSSAGDPKALDRTLAPLWQALRETRPDLPARPFGAGRVPVAVVLTEPWRPEDPDRFPLGPLAALVDGLDPDRVESFVALTAEGRFGALEAGRWNAPDGVRRGEVPPEQAAAPGSVWVYPLPEEELDALWPELRRRGLEGSGRNRELGWGRFRPWTPDEIVSPPPGEDEP